MQYTFKENSPELNPYKLWGNRLTNTGRTILEETSLFIYETPLSIVATAVASIALMLIFSNLANICFGIVLASTLSRVVIKIIDHYNSHYLMDFKAQAIEVNEKYPYLWIVTSIFATCISFISPETSLALALSYGAFKGIVIQVEIYKYKQQLRSKANLT